jgi:hypothetical protein
MESGTVSRDTARAMSEENVEVVRRFVDAMQGSFETYWKNPRSIAEAIQTETLWPEYREALSFLDPCFSTGPRKA